LSHSHILTPCQTLTRLYLHSHDWQISCNIH